MPSTGTAVQSKPHSKYTSRSTTEERLASAHTPWWQLILVKLTRAPSLCLTCVLLQSPKYVDALDLLRQTGHVVAELGSTKINDDHFCTEQCCVARDRCEGCRRCSILQPHYTAER